MFQEKDAHIVKKIAEYAKAKASELEKNPQGDFYYYYDLAKLHFVGEFDLIVPDWIFDNKRENMLKTEIGNLHLFELAICLEMDTILDCLENIEVDYDGKSHFLEYCLEQHLNFYQDEHNIEKYCSACIFLNRITTVMQQGYSFREAQKRCCQETYKGYLRYIERNPDRLSSEYFNKRHDFISEMHDEEVSILDQTNLLEKLGLDVETIEDIKQNDKDTKNSRTLKPRRVLAKSK